MNITKTSSKPAEALLGSSLRATGKPKKYSTRHFRRGRWVQIRSEAEIRATLDADEKLDGLPFMPEQVKYCGRKFRIFRRADRVYLDHHYFVVRLKNTVLLDDLRCDGTAHGGCQMKCLMFWKEAWLVPTQEPAEVEKLPEPIPLISLMNSVKEEDNQISKKFVCQATELGRIGDRLSGWDPRPYLRDLIYGERSLGEILKIVGKQAQNTLQRIVPGKKTQTPAGKISKPSGAALNLRPGDWVEVKSLAEINETLSSDNRLRGLGFSTDMIPFCGKRFRVQSRVERMILEWTGELKQLRDTVALDLVHCDGSSCRGCPRNCFFLWREDWLRRVEEDVQPT
jgi:hypothetical protein